MMRQDEVKKIRKEVNQLLENGDFVLITVRGVVHNLSDETSFDFFTGMCQNLGEIGLESVSFNS